VERRVDVVRPAFRPTHPQAPPAQRALDPEGNSGLARSRAGRRQEDARR
jgi:hypothetical protein